MSDTAFVRLLAALLVALVVGAAGHPLAGPFTPGATDARTQVEFSAEVVTYADEVAVEDGSVTVRGTATPNGEVVVAFVDQGSNTLAVATRTDAGGTYDIAIPLEDADGRLEPGDVIAIVVDLGEDEVVGPVGLGPDTADQLVQFVRNLQRRGGLSPADARDRILGETLRAPGSDDLGAVETFELASATTEIQAVVPAGSDATGIEAIPAGETMVVRGTTNRRPGDNPVRVSVVGGPSAGAFATATVNTWGRDGVWTVEIGVPPDAAPGTYVVRADDGAGSDEVGITVLESAATTTTPPPTTPPPTTSTERSPTATTPPTQPTTTTTEGPPTVTTSTPPATTTTSMERPPTTTTPGRDGSPGGPLLPLPRIPLPGLPVVVALLVTLLVGAAAVVIATRRRRRHPPRL